MINMCVCVCVNATLSCVCIGAGSNGLIYSSSLDRSIRVRRECVYTYVCDCVRCDRWLCRCGTCAPTRWCLPWWVECYWTVLVQCIDDRRVCVCVYALWCCCCSRLKVQWRVLSCRRAPHDSTPRSTTIWFASSTCTVHATKLQRIAWPQLPPKPLPLPVAAAATAVWRTRRRRSWAIRAPWRVWRCRSTDRCSYLDRWTAQRAFGTHSAVSCHACVLRVYDNAHSLVLQVKRCVNW